MNFQEHLKSLGYGAVIKCENKYSKGLWFYCQGQAADILMSGNNWGHWDFVNHKTLNNVFF